MNDETLQPIFHHLGVLLDYPGPDVLESATEFSEVLQLDFPESAEQIGIFVDFANDTSLGRLEEIYTGTFDVNPACYIYVGYLLFGESFKRGKFMVRLKAKYREHDFSAGNELPDHLALMFRFLAQIKTDETLYEQLTDNCMLPALEIMIDSFSSSTSSPNPYFQVLQVASAVLERSRQHAEPLQLVTDERPSIEWRTQ